MFEARKRPRGRNKEDICLLFDGEFSTHFRKAQIVTNAEAEAESSECEAREFLAGRKSIRSPGSSPCVTRWVFRYFATISPAAVDENLRVVNAFAPSRSETPQTNAIRQFLGDAFAISGTAPSLQNVACFWIAGME